MSERTWDVECRDFAGRQRTASVFVSGGRVVVAVPAGEVAVFDEAGVKDLRNALRDAVVETAN